MKALLIIICLVLCSNSVLAQTTPGAIMLYGNEQGTVCGIYDDVPGLFYNIYVFHMYATNVTASQFMVEQINGANLTWIGDQVSFPIPIGDSQTGIAIAYHGCKSSPLHILTITYFGNMLSADCSYLQVVPKADWGCAGQYGEIWVADCAEIPNCLPAVGGNLVINPTDDCVCDVPVEETTWGQVKALYK